MWWEIINNVINQWWWGGDPDVPNEISGMSLRDVHNVQKSWTPIYAKAHDSGYLIFVRLFQAEPEIKRFFRDLENLSEDEMERSVQFKAHILKLMTSFNTSITNLKSPELVVIWMSKLGESHARLKIPKRHFWTLKDVLVNILHNDLKLNKDVVESWGRFICFIYRHMLPKLPD